MKRSGHVLNLAKVFVAGGIIFWLVSSGRLDLSVLQRTFAFETLSVGILLVLTNFVINCFRWLLLLRAQGFAVSAFDSLRLSFVGLFFNLVMPGGVGGDLVKGYYLCRDHKERQMDAAVTVLMDRVVGFYGMVVLSMGAVLGHWDEVSSRPELFPLLAGIFGLFFGFSFIFVVGLSSRSKNMFASLFERIPGGATLKKLHGAFYSYRATKGKLFLALLISLFSQSFAVFFFVVVGKSIGSPLPWASYFFVVPLAMIAQAAPIAPAGIGVGQTAALFLFNLFLGQDSQIGPTSMTTFQVVSIGLSMVGAIFYFSMRRTASLASSSAKGMQEQPS